MNLKSSIQTVLDWEELSEDEFRAANADTYNESYQKMNLEPLKC